MIYLCCNGVKYTASYRSYSAKCTAMHSAADALAYLLIKPYALYLYAHDFIPHQFLVLV